MAELSFIKTQTGLVPHTEHDKVTYDKWKIGSVIISDFKKVRNPQFHRRFFALLNLGFDYYEPSNGVLTKDEKAIAKRIFETLDSYNGNNGVMIEFGREYMSAEVEYRKSQIENIEKEFNSFRYWLVEEAGYYETKITPTGTVKVPKSISFASMEEVEFQQLYKACFSVLWRFVLSRAFQSEIEAQNAVDNLLSFV